QSAGVKQPQRIEFQAVPMSPAAVENLAGIDPPAHSCVMNVLPDLKTAPECSGRWWKHLFEASADAQVVCRGDGTVEQINPKAARLFHLDPALNEGSFS